MEKCKEVKLSDGSIVEFKQELSWWDVQELEASISNKAIYRQDGTVEFNGESTLKAKITLLEKTIFKIVKEEKEIKFSEEWVKGLSASDGKAIYFMADNFQKDIQQKK
jgi:hypothetical protein